MSTLPEEPSGPPDDLEASWTRERVRSRLFGSSFSVTLGRYELRDILGRGAMGVVFAAYDPVLGRHAALKLVRPGAVGARRLLREGNALAQLSHPNVVRVFDAGTDRGRTYLVLERVEGRTLDEWLAAERRPEDDVIGVMLAAGSGLAAAHDQALLHRDVKPRNILIDAEGTARLGDFGLVRPAEVAGDGDEESDGVAAPASIDETTAGAVLGTPAYMAPEQLAGLVSDARADQFAYCATFYEALFGQRAFVGTTPDELRAAIERGHVDPAGAGSHWIHEVLARGLRAAPTERHASMHALLDAIRQRRDGVRRGEAALLTLDRLRRAREERTNDLETLLRSARAAEDDARNALEIFPENDDARRAEKGAKELVLALEADRRAELARQNDPSLGDRYKATWTSFVAVARALGFVGLAWADRSGALDVGTGVLTAYYAACVLAHLVVSLRIERRWHHATEAARKLSHVTFVIFAALTLVALVGWASDASVPTTLFAAQAATGAIWATAAVTFDRRLAVVVPFNFVTALAIVLWPSWALEAAAFAAGVGLGGLALVFRVSPDRPLFPPDRA